MHNYPNQVNLPNHNIQTFQQDYQKQYYNMNNSNMVNSNTSYMHYNQINPNMPNNINNQMPMYQNNNYYNYQTQPKVMLPSNNKFTRPDYNTDHNAKGTQGSQPTHINNFNINTNNKIFYNYPNHLNPQNPNFSQSSLDVFNQSKLKLTNSGNLNNHAYQELVNLSLL